MRTESPEWALTRRSYNVMLIAAFLIVIGAIGLTISFALFLFPLQVPSNPGFTTYDALRRLIIGLGVVIIVVGFALFIRALTWKRDNPLARRVSRTLHQFLGDDAKDGFVFIPNVNKLRLGYMDGVLVGPPGVLVLRISDRQGVFYNEGKDWMRKTGDGEWQAIRWNPTEEVVKDIHRLRNFMEARNLPDVPVFGVIVFTGNSPGVQVGQQNGVVPAVLMESLTQGLNETYFARDRINPGIRQQITNLLLK